MRYQLFDRALLRLQWELASMLVAVGFDLRMKTEDRRVLEGTILPALVRFPKPSRILFIGCEWFTYGYQKLFSEHDYWTLEIDPSKRRFGARQHIVDAAENLALHFKPDCLDCIVCNGVIGWGLDDQIAIERMLESCWRCLREDGVLIIGWNDVPERSAVALASLSSLKKFRPYDFPGLGRSQLVADTVLRHTYNFYVKKDQPAQGRPLSQSASERSVAESAVAEDLSNGFPDATTTAERTVFKLASIAESVAAGKCPAAANGHAECRVQSPYVEDWCQACAARAAMEEYRGRLEQPIEGRPATANP